MTGRPVFTVQLRPEPGVDHDKALRAFLKAALRRYGLKCVALSREGPSE